jgi:hypothetical protein
LICPAGDAAPFFGPNRSPTNMELIINVRHALA